MEFKKHAEKSINAVMDTFAHKHIFKPLPSKTKKIFIIGSGSSYSQALYLGQLFNDYLPYPVIINNPYSFVAYNKVASNDVCIHFSQEFKRNDNVCPLKFAKKHGLRTILFSASKLKREYKNIIDEHYWFAPETEKILVASMSYLAGYSAALKYIDYQLQVSGKQPIKYDIGGISKTMLKSLNTNFKFQDIFSVFLYAGGYAQSVAVEGALKMNECVLQDSESYEIKHYSHGKHFVSCNNNRLFNVLYGNNDKKLVDLYNGTIFEKYHTVNLMKSNLPNETAIFDWGAQMLAFIIQGMINKKILLKDIPIRNKIRVPHSFIYK